MADQNITLGNINALAETVASLAETDFVYILVNKNGAMTFSKIEKSLLLEGAGSSSSSGGMSDEVYEAIQGNVETLRQKFNALIGDLAQLAFNDSKTSTVGEFTWPDNDSGDTPVATPKITAPSGTQDIGTIAVDGSSVSKAITVKGQNLTQRLTVSVSGTGFSVSPSTLEAAAVNSGTTVTVTYSGTSTSDATGTLTISSSEVSKQVSVKSRKAADGGGEVATHTITFNSPDNSLVCTPADGWTVEDNIGWVGYLSLASGVSGKQLPQKEDIIINGSHADINYDSDTGWLSIANITSDITITASAENVAVEGYSVTNRLLNMTSDGAASVNSGEDYSATIKPSGASSNNDLRIYIGGTRLTSGYTFNQNSGALSIPASLITGDITIEATACTGVVKVKASEAATININGTAHSLSGTGEWETIGTDITAITSISASSANRSKFTAFDFGGAVANGFFTSAVGFVLMTNVTSINGLVIKATNGSASMEFAFYGCGYLSELDTIGWNLTAVTTFRNCFYNCRALTSIDVTGWVSDACTSLDSMFAHCIALTSIVGLNTWDVSSVTTMANMFLVDSQLTGSLAALDVSGWNTTNTLTNMDRWLSGSSITRLVIGNFVTSGLTSMTFPLLTKNRFTLVCTSVTPPALNSTNNLVISSNNKIGKIVVPSQAALTAYKADANWSQFTGTWEVSQ